MVIIIIIVIITVIVIINNNNNNININNNVIDQTASLPTDGVGKEDLQKINLLARAGIEPGTLLAQRSVGTGYQRL